MIEYDVVAGSWSEVGHMESGRYSHAIVGVRVAGVGWLSCTVAESLRAFVEPVFANFRNKNFVFYEYGKTGNL